MLLIHSIAGAILGPVTHPESSRVKSWEVMPTSCRWFSSITVRLSVQGLNVDSAWANTRDHNTVLRAFAKL